MNFDLNFFLNWFQKLFCVLHIWMQWSISRIIQRAMAIANSWIRNPKIKKFDLLSSFLISSKILETSWLPSGDKLKNASFRAPIVGPLFAWPNSLFKNYWRKILVHFKGNFLRKITELFARATQVLPSLF